MRRDLETGLLQGALFGFFQVPAVASWLERLPVPTQLRYLGLVWSVYALLGLGAAGLCLWLGRRAPGRIRPAAAAVAAGVWVEVASRVDGPARFLGYSVALLAGAAVLLVFSRLVRRLPWLGSPRPWAALNLAGLLLVGAWLARSPALARAAGRPEAVNVLLITIDTLRADHLGSYGASVHTPALDGLAREGVVVETAISPDPLTAPSHASILTGLYPANHGIRLNLPIPLRRGVRTLPEILAARGYRTAAFVSGFPLKNRIFRLSDRFQVYDADFSRVAWIPELLLASSLARLPLRELDKPDGWYERIPERTVEAASRWLESNPEGPFLLWVHLYAPHSPYAPPPRFARMYGAGGEGRTGGIWSPPPQTRHRRILYEPREVETLKALYAGEVSYADEQVGRLLAVLRRLGLLERTLVVATADHGESLTEHGYYFDHAAALYEPSLRVPLILRFPGRRWAGVRLQGLVGLTDVAPTVLEALGVPIPRRIDGRSLLAGLGGAGLSTRPPVISVVLGPRSLLSVRTRDGKYVWTSPWWSGCRFFPEAEELFDLAWDPGETRNIAGGEPALLARFRTLAAPYRPWLDAVGEGPGEVREEDRETLRSLGYVQ